MKLRYTSLPLDPGEVLWSAEINPSFVTPANLPASVPQPWERPSLTYAIPDQDGFDRFRPAIERAFGIWAEALSGRITIRRLAPTAAVGSSDLTVVWKRFSTSTGAFVCSRGANTETMQWMICFNGTIPNWSIDVRDATEEKWDIQTWALHEIGHVLGFGHCACLDVMRGDIYYVYHSIRGLSRRIHNELEVMYPFPTA